jgi:hypothetical protein
MNQTVLAVLARAFLRVQIIAPFVRASAIAGK